MTRSASFRKNPFLAPQPNYAPIASINTTPLVDVMLVLLIMFIMIIPVASHKVPLDLPPPAPGQPAPAHRLDIRADGSLLWNGSPLAGEALPARLVALVGDPARPSLHLNADGETRYERVDQVLAQIRTAGVTRLGFVDNRRFARAIDN